MTQIEVGDMVVIGHNALPEYFGKTGVVKNVLDYSLEVILVSKEVIGKKLFIPIVFVEKVNPVQKFAVGDKVKITVNSSLFEGKIGTITEIRDSEKVYDYNVEIGGLTFVFYEDELVEVVEAVTDPTPVEEGRNFKVGDVVVFHTDDPECWLQPFNGHKATVVDVEDEGQLITVCFHSWKESDNAWMLKHKGIIGVCDIELA